MIRPSLRLPAGILTLWLILPAAHAADPSDAPTYPAWRAAVERLPSNRDLADRLPPRELLPLKQWTNFTAVLDTFLAQCRTGALSRADAWLGTPPPAGFLDPDTAYTLQPGTPFLPFAERLAVPTGTRVQFHGDLHGDVHSLLAYLDTLNRRGDLDGFRVARPDVHLVFLGDYTDRGRYVVEVLYTLMRLRLASPGQVHLVRGNHEDVSLVSRYGFLAEVTAKYGRGIDLRRLVRLYEFLPAVLYLAGGTNAVQCNHGGMEPGYDPSGLLAAPGPVRYHLLGTLRQRTLLDSPAAAPDALTPAVWRDLGIHLQDFVPESPTTPTVLGFLWNDFTVQPGGPDFAVDPGRAFVYGERLTRDLLGRAGGSGHRVRAVFRGHQHAASLNPLMRRLIASRGVFRHWQEADGPALATADTAGLRARLETAPERAVPDGSVWTFNVSPDSVYGTGCGFAFDAAGELRVADRWEDWRLRVWNPGADGPE